MNEKEIKAAIDQLISGVGILDYDRKTMEVGVEYINDGAFRMLGTSRGSAERYIMNNLKQMILPQDLHIARKWIEDVLADNGSAETRFRYVSFQGALAHIRIKGNLLEQHGDVSRIICTFSDCTEETELEAELQKQFNLLNSAIDTKCHFDYQVRTDTCVLYNGSVEVESDETLIPDFLGKMDQLGIHKEDEQRFRDTIDLLLHKPGKDQVEYRIMDDGDYRWHQCNLVSLLGAEGYVTRVQGLIIDIHDRKMEEQKLALRADTDALTQLLNKGATEKLIRSEIHDHQNKQHLDALMMIDVDDFKYINDNFGHMVGDRVLHFVGESLKENLKGMDVAGRIGGDEFMVFLQNIKSEHDPEIIAANLQRIIHERFDDKKVADVLSVSIGIAIGRDGNEDYEELYREADEALYETKHKGKAGFTMYHGEKTKAAGE